jgi:hypothetical protein
MDSSEDKPKIDKAKSVAEQTAPGFHGKDSALVDTFTFTSLLPTISLQIRAINRMKTLRTNKQKILNLLESMKEKDILGDEAFFK